MNDSQNLSDDTVHFSQLEEKSQPCLDWLIGMAKGAVYSGCHDNEEVIVGSEVVGFLGDRTVHYCCPSHSAHSVSPWSVEHAQ